MYKSPIELIYGDIETKVAECKENMIFEAIGKVGVDVDKEELIKALQYDRQQYDRGYNDARLERLTHICSRCQYYSEEVWADMDGVPVIVAHHICSKWGNGCATKPDGFCHMWEQK